MNLGKEQQQAINDILLFIKSDNKDDICYSLIGSAGTGKSYTISQLLSQLNCDVQLCAPTHKAALVMRDYCKCNAITIHSLLSLTPKLDITKFDINKLSFYTLPKKKSQIPYKGLVICDEASMINDDLFDLLIEKCKDYKSKILFVSDKAQLLPVKGKGYSKVYTECKHTSVLTKIYRQSSENCLLPILEILREKEMFNFKTTYSEDGNLIVLNDIKDFVYKCVKDFNTALFTKDILYTKLLTYTNNAVKKYNKVIQKLIYKNSEPYHIGEIVTAYESGTSGVKLRDAKGNNIIEDNIPFNYYNGMDYLIEDIRKGIKTIPEYGAAEGYYLTLYDSYTKESGIVFIIVDRITLQNISETIERCRLNAIENNKLWYKYYDLVESFSAGEYTYYEDRLLIKKSFDLGYCCTVHRSQGSSYNKVYVDIKNIKECHDPIIRRQLEYVAFSRTRSDVIIYQ